MGDDGPNADKDVLNKQQALWENMLFLKPDMFGVLPSNAAQKAASFLSEEGLSTVLELGAGQGRDTIFLAGEGFKVSALDYCKSAMGTIEKKAAAQGLSAFVDTMCHDVRNPLPFKEDSFDACYSHMLLCMALATNQLELLMQEIRRVLKPGGIHIYTVRNTDDPHYQKGINRGDDMFEVNGFIVHFFSEEKVKSLAKGYDVVAIDRFKEGELPRKLFMATLRKR